MARKYFGTDGVRGRVGEHPMTVDFALRLASAAARVLAPNGGTVLIGKDTRLSGYMFEAALEAGFVAAGVNVMLIGPLPTPGIAYLTRKFECSFGIVISASHNLYDDNGIKFFDAEGGKLSDEIEEAIEAELDRGPITRSSVDLGRATRVDKSRRHYQDFCVESLPKGMTLEGMKLVVDCANGAGYKVVPRTLTDLGAEIIPIGCSPNGRNINDGCGSTAPGLLQLTVPGVRAAAGIALDGDGDRLVMVDGLGRIVDGDQLIYIIATARKRAGTLQGPVVGTVMSNLGLEVALREQGIEFKRAAGRRPLRAQHAARIRRLGRRRVFGTHPVAGQDHYGRCVDGGTAGARRHARNEAGARGARGRHGALPADHDQRESRRGNSIPRPSRKWKTRCRRWRCAWGATAAWSCGPRGPNRSSASWWRLATRPIPCVVPRKSPPWYAALRPEGRAAIIAPLF